MFWEIFYCFVQTWQWQHPLISWKGGVLGHISLEFHGISVDLMGEIWCMEKAIWHWKRWKCGKFEYTVFFFGHLELGCSRSLCCETHNSYSRYLDKDGEQNSEFQYQYRFLGLIIINLQLSQILVGPCITSYPGLNPIDEGIIYIRSHCKSMHFITSLSLLVTFPKGSTNLGA